MQRSKLVRTNFLALEYPSVRQTRQGKAPFPSGSEPGRLER